MTVEVNEKTRIGCINPIFTCQPAGAQFVSIGIKDCIGIVHGGQGCVMFVRLLISQHLKESFELASSSVHEDGAVFGALKRVSLATLGPAHRVSNVRHLACDALLVSGGWSPTLHLFAQAHAIRLDDRDRLARLLEQA